MLQIPKGVFRVGRGLAISHCQQVVIRGVGHGVSRLVFDGAIPIGIDVDQTSFNAPADNVAFIIEGVQIATAQNASGTALRLRQVPSVALARNGYRFYENDVLIAGDIQQTQGWAKGETLKDVENILITSSEFVGQGYSVYGANQSQMTQSSTALELLDTGCTVPGPITVVASNFYAWGTAARFAGCAQGVNFTADNMVSVGYGIYWAATPGNPDLAFHNGHINAFVTNIYVRGVPSVSISHNLFYIDPGSTTTNACMLDIGASTFGNIDHNEFWAFLSNNRTTTGRPSSPAVAGICLQDGIKSYSVQSNKFYSDGPVPASGTISFARNPETGQTLTLGTTTLAFVAGAPSASQIQIGSTVQATVANLLSFLSKSRDGQIARNKYAWVGDGATAPILSIVSKTFGPAGNGFAIGTAVGMHASGPSLAGGTGVWGFNVAYQIGGGTNISRVSIQGSMYSGGFNFGYYYDPNKPARPIAYGASGSLLVNNSPINVANMTDTAATYSSMTFDTDGFRAGSAHLVIPSGAGYRRARVCAGGVFAANDAGFRRLSIARNGRKSEPGLGATATASIASNPTPLAVCTGLIEVSDGDAFAAKWFQNSGAVLMLVNAWMSIEVRD